ncbi:MAG TPA: ABC transporter substrate-binding protein [Gammaproteobacteria bacterium]
MRLLVKTVIFLWVLTGVSAVHAGVSAYDLVKQTSDRMIEALKNKGDEIHKDPGLIYELVDEIILPHFDFERMSQLVLGKYWLRISAEEREKFTKEFQSLLVRTYANAMSDYANREIIFLPFRNDANSEDVSVKTEVNQQSGFPIPIDYSLYMKQGEWKVYDVAIDDVSLVVNYRTSFAAEIKQAGVAELIKKLQSRNRQAQNPAGE